MLIEGIFMTFDADLGPSIIVFAFIVSLVFAYLGRMWAMNRYKTWLKLE